MPKQARVHRPVGELKKELHEQLQLLQNSCQTFDTGLEAIGKHISLSLRVLLHQHGQSRSLLDQLGYRGGRFFDSAGPLNPRNLLTECNLVMTMVSASGGNYVPVIAAGDGPLPMRPIPFVDWWNEPVLKDNRGRKFCRRELVMNVANTDGGAHVDPMLDQAYMALSRENSLGWMFGDGSSYSAFSGRPELACMRQIAHEVLSTIHTYVPEFSVVAKPIIPKR